MWTVSIIINFCLFYCASWPPLTFAFSRGRAPLHFFSRRPVAILPPPLTRPSDATWRHAARCALAFPTLRLPTSSLAVQCGVWRAPCACVVYWPVRLKCSARVRRGAARCSHVLVLCEVRVRVFGAVSRSERRIGGFSTARHWCLELFTPNADTDQVTSRIYPWGAQKGGGVVGQDRYFDFCTSVMIFFM